MAKANMENVTRTIPQSIKIDAPNKKKVEPKSTKKESEKTKPQQKTKECVICKKERPYKDFFPSTSFLFPDSRCPICKDCAINNSLDANGRIDADKFMSVLRQIDKPYYVDVLSKAKAQFEKVHAGLSDEELERNGRGILEYYFKNVNTSIDSRDKTYKDSEESFFINKSSAKLTTQERQELKRKEKTAQLLYGDDEPVILDEDETDEFQVTPEMIDLFGEGYTKLEYKKMNKKYQALRETYVIQTSLHKEALCSYCRFKTKEEMATARGDVAEAQKWYQAAQDAAEKGKLTVRQISKEDLQGGITTFSDIFSAVEGAKERIQIFPEFRYKPRDAADFIIWCYVNYERNLNNMPEVSYDEIYKFYDKKKQEYIDEYGDPYGIFTDDTSESNRESIKKFITIPNDARDGDD